MNSPSSPPTVDCGQWHPLLRDGDLPAAVAVYTGKLGFRPGFLWGDPPEMTGVNPGGVSVHLAPRGAVDFVGGDGNELPAFHQANGVEIIRPPGNRPYEQRDYFLRDPDGKELAFGHRVHGAGCHHDWAIHCAVSKRHEIVARHRDECVGFRLALSVM